MELFLITSLSLFIYMNFAYITSIYKRDNSVADIFYGGGFILISIISLIFSVNKSVSFILMLMVILWGTRLVIRIFLRNYKKPEDYRYKKWRDEWGDNFLLRSYFQIYISQGIVIYIISLPIIFLANFALGYYNLIFISLGIIGWLIGFLFESIADLQLDKFIKNPENKGKLLTSGLWRYSRHPNYFGESLIWWSIALFVLGGVYSNIDIFSAVIIVSPILITFTLFRYSGIPMLEKKAKEKPGWDDYKKKTSAFVPWLPKK